jgi:hypothetical protein
VKGCQVAQVHGQRRAGFLELSRDGGFQQVIADALQFRQRLPVRLALAEHPDDQAEGVLGLPVSQQVGAVPPVGEHAEPPLLAFGQAGQRLRARQRGRLAGEVAGWMFWLRWNTLSGSKRALRLVSR